jgi:hypothetical protein
MSTEKPAASYGYCKELFAMRKGGDSLIVGGVAEDASRWTRVLTQRAGQAVWLYLIKFLFPESAEGANTLIATAAFRQADAPTITSHAVVDKAKDGTYTLRGWAGEKLWSAQLQEDEAINFWIALDKALYPNGWKGKPHTAP